MFAASPGTQFTVTELAREIGNGTGATGAAITGLLNRGELVMTAEHPRRYAASVPAQAADAAPAESAEAAPEAA